MTDTAWRMRSRTVLLGVTALAASSLTGCASEPEYAAICSDPQTHERVDDQCDDSDQPREAPSTADPA